MSSTHCLVTCVECAGTGDAQGGYYQCDVCLGQGHLNLPRERDGSPPVGYTAWKERDLGAVPINPLTLRTDAVKA